MTFLELRQKAKSYPIFRTVDVLKWFPDAKKESVLHQLSLWLKKGYLEHLRRDLYILGDSNLADSRVLSNLLYSPSYISMETALNSYGMIPDIPFETTAVTTQKTKTFHASHYGTFAYHHVKPELFFGFQTVDFKQGYGYSIALQEKALFDYFYFRTRAIRNPQGFIEEMRLSLPEKFSFRDIRKWQSLVLASPRNFHHTINAFLAFYDK